MTQKIQWCNDPISNLISIGEFLWDSSVTYGELLWATVAIQKQPLPLKDERVLCSSPDPKKGLSASRNIWRWHVMKCFYPSPINEISADKCFQAKTEFHWNQRLRAFHPVCFSSALHSSGPACYPTLNQSFFPALYASSPPFLLFHPFVPLHFHLIHPFIMLCLGWLPACSHNHRETSPLWQILRPGRTHCTGEKNKCSFFNYAYFN